jgi:hypothetical protein
MSEGSAVEKADALALRLTARRPRTWSKLVDEWARFVGEVEAGYQLTIYDYHNDLDKRGIIEKVLSGLSEAERQQVQESIEGLDRRFTSATREADHRIATFDSGFWARRTPRKLVGELASDLASDNVSQP